MRRGPLFLFCLGAAATAALVAGPPARALDLRSYSDSFADPQEWDLGQPPVGVIRDGQLLVHGPDTIAMVQRDTKYGPLTSVQVNVQYKGNGGGSGAGQDMAVVAFDVQDHHDYYLVGMSSEGSYTVVAVEKNKPRILVKWTKTKALLEGNKQNEVRIDVQPSLASRSFIVSFNGDDMPLVSDPHPTLPETGDVALGAQNGDFAFSSLTIESLPGGAETFSDDFQYQVPGWLDGEGRQVHPDHGAFHLDGTQNGFAMVRRDSGYDAQPGWLETKVSWEGGDAQDGGVGLAFAVTDSDTFYAYLVNPERGALSVEAFIAGASHPILKWTKVGLIRPGAPADLGVVPAIDADGHFAITLYIDGLRAGTILDVSSRPLVTSYGMVAVNARGSFQGFTAFGPEAPAPLFPLSRRDAVDTFASNALNWSLGDSVTIQDHQLVIDARSGAKLAQPNVPLPTAPQEIDVDGTFTGGSPRGAYGVAFDIVDPQSFYLFELAGNGEWGVVRVDGGKTTPVEKWVKNAAIVPRGRNVLSVRVDPGTGGKATLEFSVNGKPLGTAAQSSDKFFCGAVGFCSAETGLTANHASAAFSAVRFQGSGVPDALLAARAALSPAQQPAPAPSPPPPPAPPRRPIHHGRRRDLRRHGR